jgi:hypothetical protein
MENSRESIAEALQLIRQTALREPAANAESPAPSSDLAELFLVELQSRRERLRQWLRLISQEAACDSSLSSPSRKAAHKCRSQASGTAHGPNRTHANRRRTL